LEIWQAERSIFCRFGFLSRQFPPVAGRGGWLLSLRLDGNLLMPIVFHRMTHFKFVGINCGPKQEEGA